MNRNEIQTKRATIVGLLDKAHLVEAIDRLNELVEQVSRIDIKDDFARVRTNYSFLLDYLSRGVNDPERAKLHSQLRSTLYELTDRCTMALCHDTAYDVFYTRRRELATVALTSIINDYRSALNRLAMLEAVPAEQRNEGAINTLVAECEQLETKLFNKVWSTYPTSRSQEQELVDFFALDEVPWHVKALLVSALLVGSLTFYDEAKLALLLKLYLHSPHIEVQMRAITAAILVMKAYPRRAAISTNIAQLFQAIGDTPHAASDLAAVQMQLVRSRNTDNVKRQIKDEIIPGIMKMRPDLSKFSGKPIDIADFEANPEWQQWLEDSGMEKKMEEFSEMQLEGNDVFMATFAHLKSFPFFNTMSNWFLPYHDRHSVARQVLRDNQIIRESVLSDASFLCNSDRFSFCLTMAAMPQSARGTLAQELKGNSEQLAELKREQLPDPTRMRAMIVNKYVQDLYRFFKLFSRRSEFVPIFDGDMDFTTLPFIEQYACDHDTQWFIAEFYFKHGFYADSLRYYRRLLNSESVNEQIYQKMGFAHQCLGQTAQALEDYKRYELARENDLWTLRHIAACHRDMGHLDEALDYYRKVEQLQPEKVASVLNVGHCLLDMGRHDEAMQQYLKADFLPDVKHRAWRPIAWCALLQRNFERSIDYYEKIEHDDTPTGLDLMNHGHVVLCQGDVKQAIALYRQALKAMKDDKKAFTEQFENDYNQLKTIGVNPEDLPLIIDAVISTNN